MASLRKIPVEWVGASGLPGVSVFYSIPSATTALADLVAFFDAIKALFPSSLSWTVPDSGDTIEDTTGELTGSWTGAGGAVVDAAGGTGPYAAGTGAYVQWGTNAIVGGRRLKGRTFLCPLVTSVYENNGTIASTPLSTMLAAAQTLAGQASISIWHRPGSVLAGGESASVVNATVRDQVTSLRSRRR